MISHTEKEFRKYLNKICNEKLLQDYVMEFYYDLVEKYKNDFFTKENFETLNVDGYEIEQDVVKDLFINRDKVKAEEILLYLIKNNVNKIYFYKESHMFGNEVGFLDLNEKSLGVQFEKIEQYYKEPDLKKKFDKSEMYDSLTKKQKKEIKEVLRTYKKEQEIAFKKAEEQRNNHIKSYIYHEMSHIFEIKSFEKRKFLKNNATDVILTKGLHNNYIYCNCQEITTEAVKALQYQNEKTSDSKSSPTVDDFVYAYKIYGANALSEIFNEIYASKLNKSFKLEFEGNQFNYTNFIKKSKMSGTCSYNSDYDVALYVKIALEDFDDKDYRFNSQKMVQKINMLNISEEKLSLVKKKFIDFLMKNSKTNKEKLLYHNLSLKIKNFDVYSTLCLILGAKWNLELLIQEDRDTNDLKVLIQDFLVEAIKNNIFNSFSNTNVKKDEEFFKRINEILLVMDEFLWYPNNDIILYKRTENLNERKNIKIKEINLLSIEQFVKCHKEYKHINDFCKLVLKVKREVNNRMKEIDKLDEIMTYFQEQKVLDENWRALVLENTFTKRSMQNKYENKYIEKIQAEDIR